MESTPAPLLQTRPVNHARLSLRVIAIAGAAALALMAALVTHTAVGPAFLHDARTGRWSSSHAPAPALHPALIALPSRMAWAWEREEDLRWLPANAGVAYVATSIGLEDSGAVVRPRAHALHVRQTTALVPVVHVDASITKPPLLNERQRNTIAQALVEAAGQAPARVVQLDFEARLSQRQFLADVVRHARRSLPADVALSMTALASWCAGDAWMQSVPADEIVPMAFRMSRDAAVLRGLLSRQGGFARPECDRAIGTAIDEPLPGLRAPRRYAFAPKPWTLAAWQGHPF
jgi:hypothetical protein